MNLKEMKDMFDSVPDDKILEWGISEPFSWRGSYDEVCFSAVKDVAVSICKENIRKAFNEYFHGYKGGVYKYDGLNTVNFEESSSGYTDMGYVTEMTLIISDYDQDKTLVSLMTNEENIK